MTVPRKRFGQHFLCDQAVIQRIVATLAPERDQHLIEIGPGQGALTIPVLKRAKQLTAIELDRDLIPELEARAAGVGALSIVMQDVLKVDFAQFKTDKHLLRIFGNLPYNISTPFLFHLIQFAPFIADMFFMLQAEVAERIAAPAGSEHYGRLSVMVQYHCDVQLSFAVPASAFYPPPKVRSNMIKLVPYRDNPYHAMHYPLFENIVKHAFGQRRKTLRNSLRELVDDTVWAHVNIAPHLRAENLSVADFVTLSNAVFAKTE